MATLFGGTHWRVRLPAGWRGEHDDTCATVAADSGVGALQFSSARKEGRPVTDDDLRDFAAEHVEAGARLAEVSLGDFTGYHLHFGTEDASWRNWYLRRGSVALFVAYNCEPSQRGVEVREIRTILASLASDEPAA
ncbi:hypothetical protein OJF2_41400 [Aquisphaera giovannonii]|uniref:DUF3805 domain-containing protein n=2 Tax=Aquisphaera giovannonii TaxID=406548 RepID=A0A5B9W5J2_9BACT|nr:hypothetical protein OJF2_41400 [Aquisphaera giovannonii]